MTVMMTLLTGLLILIIAILAVCHAVDALSALAMEDRVSGKKSLRNTMLGAINISSFSTVLIFADIIDPTMVTSSFVMISACLGYTVAVALAIAAIIAALKLSKMPLESSYS